MAVPESPSAPVAPTARSRWRFARWLAASGAAAAAGALAGGLAEAAGLDGVEITATAAGFFALVVLPILFAGSVIVRAIYRAWRPDALIATLTEDGGGSPRFAAWLVVGLLAALGLAWALFQGTWMLFAETAFRPNTLSFAEPAIALATMVVIVALSRPAVQLVAAGVRRLDRAWRARGHRTLLRPRRVVVALAVLAIAIAYVLWLVLIKQRIGPFDVSVFLGPALAIVVTAVVHAVWRWAPRLRRVLGGVAGGLAATVIALAIIATRNDASLTLEIWNARPIAGLAIDKLFDLHRIRENISLGAFRPIERPGAPHPDIVLITIDTVRADHTPPYGGKAEMPVLQDLGARGSVFAWAFAPSNVTRRSIPSMVIGLQPNRIRGRVVGWALRIDPRHVLLAERLRAGGYETAGFMCCSGFWGARGKTGLERGLQHLEIVEDNGPKLAQTARAWLQARERRPGNRPLFLWMHILEPHNWAKGGDPRTAEERTRVYDRTLTASDRILGELLAGFNGRPPERAPITIVTADHGEALGEHGQPFHSTDLYNSQIHVPFVITGPGIAAQRIAETVSLTDLTPTIVELAGFEPPGGTSMDGRSLAALATGKRVPDPRAGTAFAAMIKDRSNRGGVTAIVRGGWKLIETEAGIELYDLEADPSERQNLVGQQQAIAAELRLLLAKRQAAGALAPFQ